MEFPKCIYTDIRGVGFLTALAGLNPRPPRSACHRHWFNVSGRAPQTAFRHVRLRALKHRLRPPLKQAYSLIDRGSQLPGDLLTTAWRCQPAARCHLEWRSLTDMAPRVWAIQTIGHKPSGCEFRVSSIPQLSLRFAGMILERISSKCLKGVGWEHAESAPGTRNAWQDLCGAPG